MQSLAFLMINCRVLSREAELSVELNDHNAGGRRWLLPWAWAMNCTMSAIKVLAQTQPVAGGADGQQGQRSAKGWQGITEGQCQDCGRTRSEQGLAQNHLAGVSFGQRAEKRVVRAPSDGGQQQGQQTP